MGKELDRWHKAGRFVTGVVVLCFFLPFFGVSCAGVDIVSISGADLVGGCQPGGDDMGGDADIEVTKAPVEPLAIISLVLVVGAAGFAWVRTRKALIASLVLSIAAIGSLAGLYIKFGGELRDQVQSQLIEKERAKQPEGGPAGELDREVSKVLRQIDVGGRMGLWAAFLLLAASAGLAGMALKDKTPSVAAAAPAAPPPPGYPPPG